MSHARTTTAGSTPKKERKRTRKMEPLRPSGSRDMIRPPSCSTCSTLSGMHSEGFDRFAMVYRNNKKKQPKHAAFRLRNGSRFRSCDLFRVLQVAPKFGFGFVLRRFCTGFYGKPTPSKSQRKQRGELSRVSKPARIFLSTDGILIWSHS